MTASLVLLRQWFTEKATEGELYLDDVFVCFTLEDTVRTGNIFEVKVKGETAIPFGMYRVVLEDSPRFGPDTLTLQDVPNFQYIRIHAGNIPLDTDGCILVGLVRTSTDDGRIGQSKVALSTLKTYLVPRLKRGEECWLHIRDAREILAKQTSPKEVK